MTPVTPLSTLRAAAVALACASLGCDGAARTPPAPPPDRAPVEVASGPAPAPDADPAAAGAEAPQPPPFTPFGLPECDGFLVKYRACVEERIPADQRGRFEDELRENRTRWWQLAEMQQGTVAVGLACRIFAQSKKTDLAVDYGCEF